MYPRLRSDPEKTLCGPSSAKSTRKRTIWQISTNLSHHVDIRDHKIAVNAPNERKNMEAATN